MLASPALPAELNTARSLVLLPEVDLTSAIAPVEVMIQEGLRCFSVPAPGPQWDGADGLLAGLRRVFGPRASFFGHDLCTEEQVDWAIKAQFAMVLPLTHDAGLLARLAAAGISYCTPALTPTEVASVWQADAPAAVQVVPAQALNNSYPAALAQLVPQAMLICRGAESAFELRSWLKAGAKFCCLGERTWLDAFHGGDLGALRRRCHQVSPEFSLVNGG